MAEERFDCSTTVKGYPKKPEQYNRMPDSHEVRKMNCPRRERTDPHTWLAPDDACKFQTDQ